MNTKKIVLIAGIACTSLFAFSCISASGSHGNESYVRINSNSEISMSKKFPIIVMKNMTYDQDFEQTKRTELENALRANGLLLVSCDSIDASDIKASMQKLKQPAVYLMEWTAYSYSAELNVKIMDGLTEKVIVSAKAKGCTKTKSRTYCDWTGSCKLFASKVSNYFK